MRTKKISVDELALPSSSDVVLDLLFGHAEHQLSAQALCKAGDLFGIGSQSMRVALTRLLQQGKLGKTGRGNYQLNPGGNTLFRDVDDWLHKENRARSWNGRWLGVHVDALARADKTIWRRHDKAIALRGFRPLRKFLYVRPDNLKGTLAQTRAELHALGLIDSALLFEIATLEPQDDAAVRALWDTDMLRLRYRALLDLLARSGKALPKLAQGPAARESLLVGREVIRHIILDPLLPAEMMPTQERHELIDAARQYQAQARSYWSCFLEQE
ncbi:PaaX family transcriptional regulator [Undibacterium sp. TJN25]|uniref:PaaX family transcriptional regulator n=1 Tax=Undibacterium sp. TJN25 TaxID=3413056 RepID=UPI003BF52BE7